MNYNVSAKLCTSPNFKRPEIIYFTRGISGIINFDIYNKAYCFDDIEQLTVMLKENNGKLHVYDAIEYFTPTYDQSPTEDNKYFKKVTINEGTAIERIYYQPLTGTEAEKEHDAGIPLFIRYNVNDTDTEEAKQYWQLNEHFSYSEGTDYSYISFLLRGDETLKLAETTLDSLIEFEVAVKLNTDKLLEQGYDAVIIERQAPIGVISTLYSEIAGSRK